MYKMLINLIKLFQSAAERSNFKQACKLNGSTWEKSPLSLFRITTEHCFQHYYCTSQEQILQLRTTDDVVSGLQHYKFRGSSLNISFSYY